MVEATARVLKNDLKRRLRKKMLALTVPVLGPYRSLVVSFMNRVFSLKLSDGALFFFFRSFFPSFYFF